jgi:hypothetical protein
VWAEFELKSVKSTLGPGEEFFKSVLITLMPLGDSTQRMKRLNANNKARMKFVNSLREAAGLTKIDRIPGEMVTRESFEDEHASTIEEMAKDFMKNQGGKKRSNSPMSGEPPQK